MLLFAVSHCCSWRFVGGAVFHDPSNPSNQNYFAVLDNVFSVTVLGLVEGLLAEPY